MPLLPAATHLCQRAPLGHGRQPFDETPLPGMPLADFVKPPAEFGQSASRLGNGTEIEKKTGSLVIAGGVAALDFGFHLLPDALASTGKGIDSDNARFRGFLRLPTAVSRGLLSSAYIVAIPPRSFAPMRRHQRLANFVDHEAGEQRPGRPPPPAVGCEAHYICQL